MVIFNFFPVCHGKKKNAGQQPRHHDVSHDAHHPSGAGQVGGPSSVGARGLVDHGPCRQLLPALWETKTIHDFQLMGPNWSSCWDDFQLRNKSTILFPIVISFPSKYMLWGSICSLNFQFLIFPLWGKTRIQSTSRITKRTVVVWVSATHTEQTSTIETYMLILGGMLLPK